jgi:hypothetical protein
MRNAAHPDTATVQGLDQNIYKSRRTIVAYALRRKTILVP